MIWKKLLENIIPSIRNQIPYNEIKYDVNGKPIDVLFHYKSNIFGDIDKNIHQFDELFLQLTNKFNIKIRVSTDLEFKITENNYIEIFENNKNIQFLGPISADDLMKEVVFRSYY